MAVTKAQKVRLGIFVLSGVGILVGGLTVLAGMKLGEKRDSYVVKYADGAVTLSGLEVGSPVKYSGIRVGRVDVIRIDPKDLGVIAVEISLTGGTPVADDTLANLGSMGITGLKYIELSRGSNAARVRQPGEEIPAGKSALDDLSSQAGEIAEKVSQALDNVNALTGPDRKDRVASVLDRTDKMLATAEATLAENRENLKLVSTNLAEASTKFEGLADALAGTAGKADTLMADAGPRLKRVLDAAANTAENLKAATGQIDALITDTRKLIGPEGAQKTMSAATVLLERGGALVGQSRENLVEGLS